MPTYHYSCENCLNEFDAFQRMTSPKMKTCGMCGKDTLVRHIGTPGLIMSGLKYKDKSGTPIWYPDNNDKPYYDKALNRVFKNRKEKKQHMDENNIVMDGSYDKNTRHREPAAGTTRKYAPIYSRHRLEKEKAK